MFSWKKAKFSDVDWWKICRKKKEISMIKSINFYLHFSEFAM